MSAAPWLVAQSGAPALPTPIAYLSLWLALAGGLVTAAGIIYAVRGWWRRGPGRRGVLAQLLRQVVVGGQLAHVTGLFGPAQFVSRWPVAPLPGHPIPWIHSWVSDDHVLRCLVDDQEVVVGWVVTSRHPGFRPSWRFDGLEVTLHRTTLAEAGSDPVWMHGANWFGYAESAGSGRPRWYQDVSIGISELGLMMYYPAMGDAITPRDDTRDRIKKVRQTCAFDTIAVRDFQLKSHDDLLSMPLGVATLQRVQTDPTWRERVSRSLRRTAIRRPFTREAAAQATTGKH